MTVPYFSVSKDFYDNDVDSECREFQSVWDLQI